MASIWSEERFPANLEGLERREENDGSFRSPFQLDYDRLLFSTPVRRLSDKTQVWPLEENDGVRTRLTHSHEVSNLAKSIGTAIYKKKADLFGGVDLHEVIQPILSSIGLAHDLGNPPFGHQGELAIGKWFEKNFFGSGESHGLSDNTQKEFLKFDGNPQSLRLLTKLQTSVANVGLNLTAATLAASLKYPVSASNVDDNNPVAKKFGYFASEQNVVDWIRKATGLKEFQRHPLTWIMEACDDIAYSTMDIEDAMKKGILSPDDVLAMLVTETGISDELTKKMKKSFDKVAKAKDRKDIARDIKVSYLRAYLIQALIDEATETYIKNASAIFDFSHKSSLLDSSDLYKLLKSTAQRYVFSHPNVLRMEALGANVLSELMTFVWNAIHDRTKGDDFRSRRLGALEKYTFSLMSQNYIEEAVRSAALPPPANSIGYREMRLLTDTISGMTDSHAVKLRDKLKALS